MAKLFLSIFMLCCLFSCDMVVYSPNEIRPDAKDLNNKALAQLGTSAGTSEFSFILTGDTQKFYEDFDDFVTHVNGLQGISFVLIDGDIVDFGLNREFNWMAERIAKIKVPTIGVIGNHDMVANGDRIFAEMFGADDFTFHYGNSKFVCINTNSREVRFDGSLPNMSYLKRELNNHGGADNIFVVSHVPPFSADFDKNLETEFAATLAAQPKVQYSLHGHDHHFEHLSPYNDGVQYVVTASTNKRSYVLVTVKGTHISIANKTY